MCFFFNDTATTEIYTLSLHDALPICTSGPRRRRRRAARPRGCSRPHRSRGGRRGRPARARTRSEEHTSELQSRQYFVCRLLLEKKTTTATFLSHMPPALSIHIHCTLT